MASDWWNRQFQNLGVTPTSPPPVPTQAPAPTRPTDALRAAQGRFSQIDQTETEGKGTYEDILSGNVNGYQMNEKKYGNLQDNSVPSHCPMCESPNFFSRRGAIKRGKPPAPHCFDCGYNGDDAYFQEATPIESGTAVESARGQTGRNLDYKHPIAYVK